jgi:hypothetical protein
MRVSDDNVKTHCDEVLRTEKNALVCQNNGELATLSLDMKSGGFPLSS